MKIISFAWTTPALLRGKKTVTRRVWDDNYAARYHKGDFIKAYDRNPRNGGKHIATIQITTEPYKEWSNSVSMIEWRNEGFEYLTGIDARCNGLSPIEIWTGWHENPTPLWVIRFMLVEIVRNDKENH